MTAAARELEPLERPKAGETYGEPPPPSASRYIHGCHHQSNYLALWKLVDFATIPATGNPIIRVPHRCGSWRHNGPCARFAAARDFARIREALENENPKDVVYFVLTLDRSQPELRHGSRWELFEALGKLQARLLHRLNRLCDRLGKDRIGSRWVSCIEQHRDGWPHINLVCVSSFIADLVRETASSHREHGLPDNEVALVGGWIREHVVGSGFGTRSTAEGARSCGAVAGYLVKMAGLVDSSAKDLCADARAVAEVAKISQAPTAAPKGFRRLRSGIRFLPPRRKSSGRWTGALVSWDGRVLRRGTVGLGRAEIALDLDGQRVYRADRPPVLIGHDAPVRRFTLGPSSPRPASELAGPLRDAETARGAAVLQWGLDISSGSAPARASPPRLTAGPHRPREPDGEP